MVDHLVMMLQQLKNDAYVRREVLERCDTHYVSSVFFVLIFSATICQDQHRIRRLRLILITRTITDKVSLDCSKVIE